MTATLVVKDLPAGIRQLTVSNPGRKNALDVSLLEQLLACLNTSSEVRAWLVRGDGAGIFCAGYDITALSGTYPPETPLPDEFLGEVLDRLSQHKAPSVALVTGPAIGAGCELALACDFRVGDMKASFAMPPAQMGIVYALKGMRRLIAQVGEGRARYMLLTGRHFEATQAMHIGLLDVLHVHAEAEALALCEALASHAPLAIQGMKHGLALLEAGSASPQECAHYEMLRRASFNSSDAQAGKEAALNKRKPHFTGR